jgi:hypothetical protein
MMIQTSLSNNVRLSVLEKTMVLSVHSGLFIEKKSNAF